MQVILRAQFMLNCAEFAALGCGLEVVWNKRMRQRFVIGNWKLNGSLAANQALLSAIVSGASSAPKEAEDARRTMAFCVPAPYFGQIQAFLAENPRQYLGFGSQDVSQFESGAYTGEVSASMVKEFEATFAIVGHSERRALFGNTDQVVAEKFACAKTAGLTPILCVGESLAEREAGKTNEVVARQLEAVIAANGISALEGAVLAYEPVWAIGTGKTATPEQAQAVHAFLRGVVAAHSIEISRTLPILYGGSVKKSNAADLFAEADIDGALVGGASLVAEEFLGIWSAL
jgi:triosephosphate isomerase (TIM)